MPLDKAVAFLDELQMTNAECYSRYYFAVKGGMALEMARLLLPLTTMTEFYMTFDLRNFLAMSQLRMDPHAQDITRRIAESAYLLCQQLFPICCKAFEDYKMESMMISGKEIEAFRRATGHISLKDEPVLEGSERENQEFKEKLKRLGVFP